MELEAPAAVISDGLAALGTHGTKGHGHRAGTPRGIITQDARLQPGAGIKTPAGVCGV